jgi:hypothetical protein
MTMARDAAAIVFGLIHGFIVWRLLFRLVGPVARVSQGRRTARLRTSISVAYVVSFLFLLVCALLLLQGFGAMFSRAPTRDTMKYLYIGSLSGFGLSVVLPRAESRLRAAFRAHRSKEKD